MRVPFPRSAPSPEGTLLDDCVEDGLAMPVVVSLLKLGAFPLPLGSLPELFNPAALAGPGGTPLTPVVPAPAEPARGEPAGLVAPVELAAPPPDELPLLPPPPCAKATDEARANVIASATVLFIIISQDMKRHHMRN